MCSLSLSLIQVMDWIENHGEAFLSKHTGVGKSLHRARALQKRHDDFEDVAQVTNIVMKRITSPMRNASLNATMSNTYQQKFVCCHAFSAEYLNLCEKSSLSLNEIFVTV